MYIWHDCMQCKCTLYTSIEQLDIFCIHRIFFQLSLSLCTVSTVFRDRRRQNTELMGSGAVEYRTHGFRGGRIKRYRPENERNGSRQRQYSEDNLFCSESRYPAYKSLTPDPPGQGSEICVRWITGSTYRITYVYNMISIQQLW